MPGLDDIEDLWAELQEALEEVKDRGDEAEEFAESVEDKALSIMTTVQETNRCTDGQYQAIKNMLNGAKKWL